MFENKARAEFVNFLLNKKYNLDKKNSNILNLFIKEISGPAFLLDFNCDLLFPEIEPVISVLENEIEDITDEKIKDLVFGILYCSLSFIKEMKKSNFDFNRVKKFYTDRLLINKKLLSEFHCKSEGKINISLPQKIVTRFPPEPNGCLHIGHAKAAILNNHLAKEGKMIFRFDDTNPANESKEYEDMILEDMKLLGIDIDSIVRTSDHFDEIYRFAVSLIRDGKAFVDNTPVDKIRELRMNSLPSTNRDLPVEENLERFEKMWKGDSDMVGFVLRAKMTYDSPNACMRDPVIYRKITSSDENHKLQYSIYPTYDFACPIVDSLDGVTLALRSIEYNDRNEMYNWFLDNLKLSNRPKIFEFSRLNFEKTVLSKRKIKYYIENKFVESWDDPRLATLRGIKRRGLCMEVLRDYIISQGASKKTSVFSWDKLWTLNKRFVDCKSPRISGVPLDDHVVCEIFEKDGVSRISEEYFLVERNTKNPSLGQKRISRTPSILISREDADLFSENTEFTLLKLGNVVIQKIVKDEFGKIKFILIENFGNKDTSTTAKISWVPATGGVIGELFEYGDLQNDKETEDLAENFNTKDSKTSRYWILENDVLNIQHDQHFQLERIGFYYCDSYLKFNLVPNTKQKRKITKIN